MSRDRRNRRAPQARYLQFCDEGVQSRFIGMAEDAYARVARADAWSTEETIEVPTQETVVVRRGVLRRSREVTIAAVRTPVTLVLAEAQRVAAAVPATMNAVEGCSAGRRVATLVAEVLSELVRALATAPVSEQRTHPDYRQMMRLTAELTALAELTEHDGCREAGGCVELRRPEAGGRRDEDVEITKFRSVLLQRSKVAAS